MRAGPTATIRKRNPPPSRRGVSKSVSQFWNFETGGNAARKGSAALTASQVEIAGQKVTGWPWFPWVALLS